ncbi:glycosyltransferase family 2 protein [Winogradskyella sediminis]|uniref:glycosyltransferase family 2 protein n=1 Tax=Winogradskyella sediminis TaxID=1382466 RepID=UPI000E270859|nr:glycosyltransferase family 2 protein [Winogradskyella sediminis]REG87721.1 glycosyltransferase involved in cell wall biosynthesis [Winogradskyella sediminis]
MTKSPLVSIIIPTYNRAHLISETLDSVLAQTYQNWECIVVDDGSTDGTDQLMASYCAKDSRFHYHHRPDDRLPGGNAARNYGFEVSKGEYVQWFDSDDLMVSNRINSYIEAFNKNNVDFVISKSKFFNYRNDNKSYSFKNSEISFLSFSIGNVSWITNDFIVSKRVVKKIKFNESLKAGQEYNFICKLLLISEKSFFINEFLTLRRYHNESIQGERNLNKFHNLNMRFYAYWSNYLDIKDLAKMSCFDKFALQTCSSAFLMSKNKIKLPRHFYTEIVKVFGYNSFFLFLAIISNKFFNKYHKPYLIFKKRVHD